jgi:hypothetical protein
MKKFFIIGLLTLSTISHASTLLRGYDIFVKEGDGAHGRWYQAYPSGYYYKQSKHSRQISEKKVVLSPEQRKKIDEQDRIILAVLKSTPPPLKEQEKVHRKKWDKINRHSNRKK